MTDWHNRLGTWTLPFCLMIAITGGAMGLGAAVYPAIADSRYGGDLEQAYAPIFGSEPADDHTSAPIARADKVLRWMAANHADKPITYVVLEHPGTAGQQVQIIADHEQRLIYGETYLFNGAGEPTGTVGLSDGPLGQQAIASVYKLHFGNFAGLPVQLAYFAFGIVLCAITATGIAIWLAKRRQRGLAMPRAEGAWAAVVWGTPLILTLAALARIIAGPDVPFTTLFWLSISGLATFSIARPDRITSRSLRIAFAAALLALGILHLMTGTYGSVANLVIDLGCCLVGMALLLFSRQKTNTQAKKQHTQLAVDT